MQTSTNGKCQGGFISKETCCEVFLLIMLLQSIKQLTNIVFVVFLYLFWGVNKINMNLKAEESVLQLGDCC